MEAQHSKPRPSLSLAAGIIYLNPAAFAGVKQTLQTLHIASIIGVPAVTPKDYAYSRAAMVAALFGGDGQQHTHAMSSNEIALALSHRKALRRLAQERTRWAAVFEEDAALHPKLVPTPQTAIGLLRHALTRSRFAYLGACRPTCPASGSASGCFAYCTHAYALERAWAATFFDDVYCSEDVLAGAACGSHCRTTHCHTDQQFVRYFKRVPNASVAGYWLVSPDTRFHRGLFYQVRNRNQSGTQLAGEATYEAFKGKRVITAAGRRLDVVARVARD